jgi:hypothetical protein
MIIQYCSKLLLILPDRHETHDQKKVEYAGPPPK